MLGARLRRHRRPARWSPPATRSAWPCVALAWVLAQPGVTSAIIGAKRPEQLAENLAAIELELTAQDLAELDAASALPVEYPAWIQTDHTARFPQTA